MIEEGGEAGQPHMDIVMKVAPAHLSGAVKLVTDLLREVLPAAEVERASVAAVFPNVTTGRRAGMLVLSLDDETPSGSVAEVLDSLRSSAAVEYAQPAASREPLPVGAR
jgi:hypothetical protein